MRFGSTSMTDTGTFSPASVKMRVMPALRPIRATLMTILCFIANACAPAVRATLQLVLRGVASRSRGAQEDAANPDGGRESRVVLVNQWSPNLARFRWKSIAWDMGPRRKGAQYIDRKSVV